MNKFTAKQKEIVARKLGYDGPMQGFDDFIKSSPALGMKYATIGDKFATRMAKGGVVRKKRGYQAGGLVESLPTNWTTFKPEEKINYFNEKGITPEQLTGVGVPQSDIDWMKTQGYSGVKPAATGDVRPNVESAIPFAEEGSAASVIVYGPDGTMYSSPAAAARAGVPAATTSPSKTVNDVTSAGNATETINMTTGAVTTDTLTSSLPTNWNTYNAAAKINYFNEKGITEAQLKAAGVPQSDIDYMKNNGYKAGVTSTGTTGGVAFSAGIQNATVEQKAAEYNRLVKSGASDAAIRAAADAAFGKQTDADWTALQNLGRSEAIRLGGVTTAASTPAAALSATGAPNIPGATTITAAQTATPTPAAAGQAAPTQAASVTNVAAPVPIDAPTPIVAPTATAASAATGVSNVLTKVDAQQGVVSETAKAIAAQQAPETTAVAGVEAAQGVAGTVQGAPTRVAEAGEMVSGPSVDMARVEQTLAQTQAAQGVVTDEMTVQGQLNKLTRDFDAGNPPPWAAASMRAATAQLAARGLGASSMAGQAIIQATLEAATPIAAADAKVFETMGLQNLSNRQQTAMLIGQQRAAFLGQEFDQAFQTKVLNAAKISDIANRNFDAQTTIAIENSRLANSMDIANLSARNAVVLGKMAQMSQLETQNLSNRQQVAVENARAALTMDIKNLDNRQQTVLFRAQEMNDALLSDAGFANATAITNATNALDAAKVSATLMQSAQQFNADQLNKVNMTNALAANEIGKFNAQQAQQREEFNANMTTQINLANARILAEVSTANTAAINAAAAINAKNATDLSAAAYAQQSQTYRDLLEMSWKTGESEKDRTTQITAATLTSSSSVNAARITSSNDALSAIAKAGITLVANYDKVRLAFKDIFGD
jgi:hypothetical protein